MHAEALFKAVADKNRLRILSLLKSSPKVVEQIAKELNISVSTASFHLEKLKAAGLVCDEKVQYYRQYHLSEELLRVSLMDIILSSEPPNDTGGEFEREVLDEAFASGKLEKLPVQKMKRDIVLREIAKGLKKNKAYTEREINIFIADKCDDFVTVRKELVSLGLVKFDGQAYRKI